VQAAFVITSLGHEGFIASHVDPDAEHNMMIGLEGRAKAGSLFPEDRIIRGIAWRVENTQNVVDPFRRTGAEAVVRPNVQMEAIPEQVTEEMLRGTGVTMAMIDPYRKFDYFFIKESG
jgi:hypothetical protein